MKLDLLTRLYIGLYLAATIIIKQAKQKARVLNA